MPAPGARVESVCADILVRVSRSHMSIRYFIDRAGGRAPRALLNALCLGVLRNYKLLHHLLETCGVNLGARWSRRYWLKLVGAYEARFRGGHVSLPKAAEATGLNVRDLRCVAEKSLNHLHGEGLEGLSILYSIPLWVLRRLEQLPIPGGLTAMLEYLQRPAPLWLRYNISMITRKDAVEKLRSIGVNTSPDPVLDDMLLVTGLHPGSLSRLDSRLFYPQDRSSALVAHVLEKHVHPRSILDVFSAPGNKIAHLAWRHKTVYAAAIDLAQRRIAEERVLHRRQGIGLIDYIIADARFAPIRAGWMDTVIVDPDCTSLGRLGHSPETRLFLEVAGPRLLRRLVRLQRRSLREAARRVPKGGVIVYATCTLTREENEDVVELVASEEGLELIDATDPLIGVEGLVRGTQRVYPHIANAGGGFVALLRR